MGSSKASTRWVGAGAAVAVTCFAALSARSASAQAIAPGFAINRFEPSERGSEWFVADSLDLRGKVRPAIGVVGDWGFRPQRFHTDDGVSEATLVDQQIVAHVGASLVLFDRLRVAFSVPFYLAQSGHDVVASGVRYVAPTSGGIGDVRFGADLRVVGAYGDPFTAAIGARLWAPSGKDDQLTGDHETRGEPHVLFAGTLGSFVYGASVGVEFRKKHETEFAGYATGNELTFSAALGARISRLVIGPELAGAAALSGGPAPVFALLGAHYGVGDWRFGIGAGPGLSHAAGNAIFRLVGSIEWAPGVTSAPPPPSDRDGDGIVDAQDACPDKAGPKSDDPKKSGCPLPSDRDHDTIVDTEDACPDKSGPKSDDPKKNGCPLPGDRDHDGVVDELDACIDAAGIHTDDPKTNGCPDTDNDGVPDKVDACVDVPGVKSDDPAKNGCPLDSDGDSIPDADDACPKEPGAKNADPKKNGCPAVKIEAGQIKILEQIKFKTASAEILPESDPILQEVAKTMTAHPEIKKIRVEGHTDNKGTPAYNKDLSGKRANAVAAALVKLGVEKSRLTSIGKGQDVPIDTNATEEGRANNRRVEFHIEDK